LDKGKSTLYCGGINGKKGKRGPESACSHLSGPMPGKKTPEKKKEGNRRGIFLLLRAKRKKKKGGQKYPHFLVHKKRETKKRTRYAPN